MRTECRRYAERTVAPTSRPVSLDRAKNWLRVDHSQDDEAITGLLDAATDALAAFYDRSITPTPWTLHLSGFPDNGQPIDLPRGPVSSVSTVQYRDTSGTWQTMDSADWVTVPGDPLAVEPADRNTGWPATFPASDAVRVSYAAGYTSIPGPVVQAILVCVADWYGNRGDQQDAPTREIPAAAINLMRSVGPGVPL